MKILINEREELVLGLLRRAMIACRATIAEQVGLAELERR
jgi:hypothetical protein